MGRVSRVAEFMVPTAATDMGHCGSGTDGSARRGEGARGELGAEQFQDVCKVLGTAYVLCDVTRGHTLLLRRDYQPQSARGPPHAHNVDEQP